MVPVSNGVVSAHFDQPSGSSGDVVHLTLSVSEPGSVQGIANAESVAIVSQLGARAVAWPILITNP
jgi:hypothetical protein